jgi:hypothetical protein
MTPCSFIRGNVSEEISTFVFNMEKLLSIPEDAGSSFL